MDGSYFFLLFFQMFWQFSDCQNIALNKPTTMINTRGLRLSLRAVDGDLNRSDIYYCTHTDFVVPDIPMWWAVDLLSRYMISNVKILNRIELAYRLRDFLLTVWDVDPGSNIRADDKGNYCTCAHYPGILPNTGLIDIPCTQDCTGRFVAVILRGSIILTLCEVEVYGQRASELVRNGAIFRKIPNKRLIGSSVNGSWISKMTSLQCSMHCLNNNQCLGYNYRSYTGNNNCLLISSIVHYTDDFLNDVEWEWMTIRLLF